MQTVAKGISRVKENVMRLRFLVPIPQPWNNTYTLNRRKGSVVIFRQQSWFAAFNVFDLDINSLSEGKTVLNFCNYGIEMV